MGPVIRPFQAALGAWPRLYIEFQHVRYRGKPFARRIVRPSTDVVIEGFPRSGNSFAYRAFADSQPGEVGVATHSHHSAQVRRAAALSIPTLVVVRHPSKCIPSYYALLEQSRASNSHGPPLDVAWALKRYAAFHRNVLKVQDHILLVRFEDVIRDYGNVIERFNQRFGCNFVPFEHTAENVSRLFASAKPHLSPNPARQTDAERGMALYCAAPYRLRARAETAYQLVCDVADAQSIRTQA